MANWAWPHTPPGHLARVVLTGGPFDGEEVASVPPDHAAPAQVVWGGWFPWGFAVYLYEWHGERTMAGGRTDALIFRPGRRLLADEIPPILAEDVELWADTAARFAETFADLVDIPRELIWPGL